MPEDRRPHQLILFDIDGTLVYTGGAGSRAMTRALAVVCPSSDGFEGIPMAGRTDRVILADALGRAGFAPTPDLIERFRDTYHRFLVEELQHLPATARVLPGVAELVPALAGRPRTTVSLLTGNYSDTARLKLERFGLWRWFVEGAFGEDAAERPGLVPVAIERARRAGMQPVAPGGVVIVGDTPLDVETGRLNHARTVAVATGASDRAALEAAGADVVFEDLSETAAVLAALDRLAGT